MRLLRAYWNGILLALVLRVRRPRWLEVGESEVHVVPLEDFICHEPNGCVCGPDIEPCPREDGSMAWLITHHSLDGREASE